MLVPRPTSVDSRRSIPKWRGGKGQRIEVALTKEMPMESYFLLMTAIPIAFGVVLFILAKPVQRMLASSSDGTQSPGH